MTFIPKVKSTTAPGRRCKTCRKAFTNSHYCEPTKDFIFEGWPRRASPDHDECVREHETLKILLGDTLTPDAFNAWFSTPNELLDGRKPWECIADGWASLPFRAAIALKEGVRV
jgi:hypothetical protein